MVHTRGCFSAVLIIDVLLNGVRGEDMSEEGTDFRFVLLGVGIGVLLALCLLVVKLYTMGKCKCTCTEAHMHSGGYKLPSFTTPQSSTRPSLEGGLCTQHSTIHI
ncbi:unnamed protein product [Gadus morhua 'NCC']